jgi:hypothetical protein
MSIIFDTGVLIYLVKLSLAAWMIINLPYIYSFTSLFLLVLLKNIVLKYIFGLFPLSGLEPSYLIDLKKDCNIGGIT